MIKHIHSTKAAQRVFVVCLAALSVLLAVLVAAYHARPVSAVSLESHVDYSDIEEEGDVYFDGAIDYLIEKGVLEYDDGGCDDAVIGKFCHGEEIPRWQVAVWIARALNVLEGNDPDPTDTPDEATFSDVDIDDADIWWALHVEFLYEEGVTGGCGDDTDGNKRFCPNSKASRAQMATMLKRAFDSIPEATKTDVFFDVVPGSTHADAIDDIRGVNITVGCTNEGQILASSDTTQDEYDANRNKEDTGNTVEYFCPNSGPRGQMACLLARAMSLEDESKDKLEECHLQSDDGELPDTGADRDLLAGSLFIGSLTAAIIFGKIYYDNRRRVQAR